MKKLVAVVLATMLLICLFAGCGGKNEQMINPMVSYDSVAKINEAVGCNIKPVTGAENELFFVTSGTLAEYRFDLDKNDYCIRAAKEKGDITGVYGPEGTLGESVESGTDVTPTDIGYSGSWARWFDGEMQYTVYSSSATAQELSSVVENEK